MFIQVCLNAKDCCASRCVKNFPLQSSDNDIEVLSSFASKICIFDFINVEAYTRLSMTLISGLAQGLTSKCGDPINEKLC
jgi:hypothetical protein